MKRNICIDISNIIPGQGGSGGGVSTYAVNLIENLGKSGLTPEYKIICIKSIKLQSLTPHSNIRFVDVDINKGNLFSRLLWLNIQLPWFCILNRVHLLHRVIPEMPIVRVCKYVCTLHDLMFDLYIGRGDLRSYLTLSERVKFHYFKWMSKMAVGICSKVIVPSNTIRNEVLLNYQLKKDNLVVIYEASNNGSQWFAGEKSTVNSKLKLGVVAGFYPHKGHLQVLKMAHRLVEGGFRDFFIYFRGNPTYPKYVLFLENKIHELNLSNYVKFVPFCMEASIEDIYADFDYLLLLSEYEGFGLPVLESQAQGLPVICSDIPIFRELLGQSAMFVPRDLNRNFIKTLVDTLGNKKFIDWLRASGFKNANQYSWNKMAAETANVFVQVLANDK